MTTKRIQGCKSRHVLHNDIKTAGNCSGNMSNDLDIDTLWIIKRICEIRLNHMKVDVSEINNLEMGGWFLKILLLSHFL